MTKHESRAPLSDDGSCGEHKSMAWTKQNDTSMTDDNSISTYTPPMVEESSSPSPSKTSTVDADHCEILTSPDDDGGDDDDDDDAVDSSSHSSTSSYEYPLRRASFSSQPPSTRHTGGSVPSNSSNNNNNKSNVSPPRLGLAHKENTMVTRSKAIVALVLILATILVASATFHVTQQSEAKDFQIRVRLP
jgi:hypothetical protein